MKKQLWTEKEWQTAQALKAAGKSRAEIAEALGRTFSSVDAKFAREAHNVTLPSSPYPSMTSALVCEGDAVILSDVEAPFQHADFIARVLDLAGAWGIKNLILAGDMIHYNALNNFGAMWQEKKEQIIGSVLEQLRAVISDNSRAMQILIDADMLSLDSFSDELRHVREFYQALSGFDVYAALGNHDDRLLRRLDETLEAAEIFRQMGVEQRENWHIAPYYYVILRTETGEFRITHPRSSAKNAAIDLAVQYHQHIIMGHSHRWSVNRDPSGRFWAIQTGHCVDEQRLAYVMQRDAKRDAHVLGATIVRGGYPFVLSPEAPWHLLKRM